MSKHITGIIDTRETADVFFTRLDVVIADYERLMKAKRGDYQERPKPAEKPKDNVIIGPWGK